MAEKEEITPADKELVESVVAEGWNRAQGIGYAWGEITDAYRNEAQIKEALRIGAEETLKALRKGHQPTL